MPPLFALLALMLVGVVLVSLLLLRFQQSLLVGYFLIGVVIANCGAVEWLGSGAGTQGRVGSMAEFGVILLMFTLGLEFSLGELKFLRRMALLGGGLQVVLTLVPVALLAAAWGLGWGPAVALGATLAISSTAVSVKVFQDLGLPGSPGARLALGVAIFQDIFVIGFMLVMPLLFSSQGSAGLLPHLALLLGEGLAFVAASYLLARWVIPRLLHAVARSRSRELFTLTVIGLCVGLAFLGGLLGLSLALGAFVAGLAVSESIYKHRILADILPVKDLFLTLFFVSVGLMIDIRVAWENGWLILLVTAALMAGKALLVTQVGRRLGAPWRASLLAGLSLSSAGEFSLVLFQRAGELREWPGVVTQVGMAAIALSMALVPSAMRLADPLVRLVERLGWSRKAAPVPPDLKLREKLKSLQDHAIVCGYGPVGRALVGALDELGVRSLIIELNADTVRSLQRQGRPVLFADAGHSETWALAAVERARLVAFTFPDPSVIAAALPLVRDLNADITVLARTKFSDGAKRLKNLGADLVIHDEEETALAMVREAAVVIGGS